MEKRLMCSLVAGGLLLSSATVWAGPVQWGTNGHWYEAVHVSGGIDWNTAKTNAEAMGGYLATITSADENNFVFSLIDDPKYWFMDGADNNEGPWLGGYYAGPVGGMDANQWAWVSGESWGYSNWDNGEPNFPSERSLNYFSNDASSGNQIRQSYWNNVPESSLMYGYVVERNTVPVPAAVWLLGSGLLGLFAGRRKVSSS